MTKEKFNEVINFAISGEKEASKFYQELQEKVKFQAQIEMLKEFEDMEKCHVATLENIPTLIPTPNIKLDFCNLLNIISF